MAEAIIAGLILQIVGGLGRLYELHQKAKRGEEFTAEEQAFVDQQVEDARRRVAEATGHGGDID